MKIAFLVNSFPKLSETFILNQITGLMDLGHDVEIFALAKPKENIKNRDIKKYNLVRLVNYINIPKSKVKRIFKTFKITIRNSLKNPFIIFKYLNFFKYKKTVLFPTFLIKTLPFFNKKFDILHCCYGPNGNIGALLKDMGVINGKLVTSFHGYDISSYILKNGRSVYDFLFKNGDIFLPVSEYGKNKLIELGCPINKIVVRRTGIDLKKFTFRKKLYNNKKIKLISIGRLVEKKGFEYGISAIAILVKEFPSIDYNIIGDGPLKKCLNELIIRLSLENNVRILGYKTHEEVVKLLYESDIMIAPSVTAMNGDQEGIPNTLKEAMATGLPVISTKHTGIPELVTDGETGFIVSEKDVEVLADKITYLIKYPEVGEDMGIKGRKFVERNYDIKIQNIKLQSLYKKILQTQALKV